jgi:hypothetical protein
LTDGIDMLARDTGRLLYRIQIPVTTADVYDSLVVASGTNTVAVITASGVSFVDLSSLPIPAGDTQPFPQIADPGRIFSADVRTNVPAQSKLASVTGNLKGRPMLKHHIPGIPAGNIAH